MLTCERIAFLEALAWELLTGNQVTTPLVAGESVPRLAREAYAISRPQYPVEEMTERGLLAIADMPQSAVADHDAVLLALASAWSVPPGVVTAARNTLERGAMEQTTEDLRAAFLAAVQGLTIEEMQVLQQIIRDGGTFHPL